jgi:hypothetical protein
LSLRRVRLWVLWARLAAAKLPLVAVSYDYICQRQAGLSLRVKILLAYLSGE